MAPQPLYQSCTPRSSVFDASLADTVYDLNSLREIDAPSFFAENYVTAGMKQLLTEGFKRLGGSSHNTSGAFLLSQSMGGGKTHNLLALGLLALHPELRDQVMGSFQPTDSLGKVNVVAFSGRKTNTPYGLWHELADQLGKAQVFNNLYSPLRPPGDDDWVTLLAGRPTLILLDELPPYFEATRATPVGGTTLDVITTTALANLLVAVNSGKLPNVCVVMTDLRASAYGMGQNAINQALGNLERETQRSVTRIDPVQLNSDELYHILRTRLFERVGDAAQIEAVASAFGQAVAEANRVDQTKESAAHLQQSIVGTYPFHPGIRDLYARFRDNPGFQQTRALIRIMRSVVAGLWSEDGAEAKRRYLIGAHDLDFLSSDIASEIRNINGSFENAIAHDIVDTSGTAVAQQIDAELQGRDARDAAALIFLASLSQAVDPTLGLDRGELVGMLAAPQRDLGRLNEALDELQRRAWYLHASAAGKLFFRNVENINARLENYAQQAMDEDREVVLRERLQLMFKPVTVAVYQSIEALPRLDEVTPAQNRTTLVVFRPAASALAEIREFWDHQQWKNRVLFLTGETSGYHRVLEEAAYLRAIGIIVREFRQKNVAEGDEQMITALERQSKIEGQFYLACRETFQSLYYPSKNGLTPLDVECVYAQNKFEAESQITNALREVHKYTDKTSVDDGFASAIETRLWPMTSKEVAWSQIQQNAASNPAWAWHHTRALDEARDEMVKRGQWRDLGGGFYEKGPFPPPSTEVSVQQLSRNSETGEATLRVRPLHGDLVYYAQDASVSTSSPRLEGQDLKTSALTVQFLAVDSTGEHQTGEPYRWQNSITMRYHFYDGANGRMCELRAAPSGTIRYSTDASSPIASGTPYGKPFSLPAGAAMVQAIGESAGIYSETLRAEVPRGQPGAAPTLDFHKPATYLWSHSRDSSADAYAFCDAAHKRGAQLAGVALSAFRENHWLELRSDDALFLDAATVRDQMTALRQLLPDGTAAVTVTLGVEAIKTPSGQDLLDLVEDMKGQLDLAKVRQ